MKAPIIKYINRSVLATLSFGCGSLSAEERPGGLQREVWDDIKGAGLWHLRNAPAFHREPTKTEFMEGAVAPGNAGDNYGQRLRGYVIPQISGEYTFWIASDDNSELCLSSDDSKFNKVPVAMIFGLGKGARNDRVEPLEWERFKTQKSEPIMLEAGNRYFIEALHKEGEGDDHLAIA